jgi:hypothetical protein
MLALVSKSSRRTQRGSGSIKAKGFIHSLLHFDLFQTFLLLLPSTDQFCLFPIPGVTIFPGPPPTT